MSDAAFFVAGGTVPPGAASYVERAADRELFEALLAGEFCYVLNSRQMGKSSLAVRTIAKLNDVEVKTAFVDLTRLGATGADPERWYAGLLAETGRALGMRGEAMAYLRAHPEIPAPARLFGFLRDVALASPGRIVLMIDEIDAVRSLPFSADDLFAGLRELWNARASDPEAARLTVCLLGAALPGDLIRDPRRTPFNVGRRIELRDFTPQEAAPFAAVMGEAALARVLRWTGGHPYLTQAVCAALARNETTPTLLSPKGEARSTQAVDALVRERYLDARARDADANLVDVGNRLLGTGDPDLTDEGRADALSLYEKVLRGRDVPDDEANPAAARIKMSGVARVEDGKLRVRNRLYREAFGLRWVRENTPGQERRRQRKAFWRGALRSGLVGTAVAVTIAGLAVNAELSRREADRLRKRADADRKEALFQRDEARAASEALARSTAKLNAAYETQTQLTKATSAAALEAKRQRDEAVRQKALAQTNATEATRQRDRAAGQTRLAETNAAAERAQRGRADAQSSRLAKELYVANMGEIGRAWQDRQFARAREMLQATKGPFSGWEWGYWDRRLGAKLAEVPLAGTRVLCRGDGRHVLLDGNEDNLQVFDMANGHRRTAGRWLMPIVDGFGAGAYGVSANGRWAICLSSPGRLTLDELATGRRLAVGAPARDLLREGLSDDGSRYVEFSELANGGQDRRYVVRQRQSGAVVAQGVVAGSERPVALSPDGKRLLLLRSVTETSVTLREIDLASGAACTSRFIEGTSEHPVDFWNASAGYAASGGIVWCRTPDRFLVYDHDVSDPRIEMKGLPSGSGASVSWDGSRALLLNDGQDALLADLARGGLTVPLPVRSGAVSPDGREVWSYDHGLTRFDPVRLALYETGKPLGADSFGMGRAFSLRDGRPLRCEFGPPLVRRARGGGLYQVEPLRRATVYEPDGRPFARLAASGLDASFEMAYSDGWNLSVGYGGNYEVWRLPELRLVRRVENVASFVRAFAWHPSPSTSPDGRRTFYYDASKRLALLQRKPDGTDERFDLGLPRGTPVAPPSISPNGRWAASLSEVLKAGGKDAVLELWDLDARVRSTALWHPDQLLWTPDGNGALMIGKSLVRRDLVRGTASVSRSGLREGAAAVCLSPDGSRLAYSTPQGLWLVETSSGQELLTLDRFDGKAGTEVKDLCFLPGGRALVSAMADGSHRVYRASPPPVVGRGRGPRAPGRDGSP